MEEKFKIDRLLMHLREYVEERVKLSTLNIHDKVSQLLSDVVSGLIIILFGVFTLLFLSLALSWWLGSQLNNPFLGFLMVGCFYLIVVIVIYLNRTRWIRVPALDLFLKNITNEED